MTPTATTIDEVCVRDGYQCIECGKPGIHTRHHCLPQSEYKRADKNQAWNIVNMCQPCQTKVHKSETLLQKYRELAISRRPAVPELSTGFASWVIERLVGIELLVATQGKPTSDQSKRAKAYTDEMKRKFTPCKSSHETPDGDS